MQSHVIIVSGTFAGAAIRIPSLLGDQFRFIAVDPHVEELDQSMWPSLDAVSRAVGHLLRTGRLPPRDVDVTETRSEQRILPSRNL